MRGYLAVAPGGIAWTFALAPLAPRGSQLVELDAAFDPMHGGESMRTVVHFE